MLSKELVAVLTRAHSWSHFCPSHLPDRQLGYNNEATDGDHWLNDDQGLHQGEQSSLLKFIVQPLYPHPNEWLCAQQSAAAMPEWLQPPIFNLTQGETGAQHEVVHRLPGM